MEDNLNKIDEQVGNNEPITVEEVVPKYYTYENTNNTVVASDLPVDENKKNKKKGGFLKKFVAVIVCAAVFGASAGVGFYFVNRHFGNDEEKSANTEKNNIPIATTVVSANTVETKSDIADIVEDAMPFVVSITCTTKQNVSVWPGYYSEQELPSSGSGIVIGENEEELLIVTNNHVVEDVTTVSITFNDGESYDATIKGTDSSNDLAVCSVKKSDLKEDTAKAIKIAVVGDSQKLRTGELAIAIGNALGYGQSVTKGCISALSREITIDGTTYTVIQTDAAINPGNSGGALLNGKGEVIGINSAKLASEDVEGMGYAIPISKVLPIIQDLMNKEYIPDEEKGYLGVTCSTVGEEISELYNCPEGVLLREVNKDGPADKAGLLNGDIVTKIDGIEVKTNEQFIEKVGNYKAGDKVTLTIERFEDGRYGEMTVEVTLGERPEGFTNKVPENYLE